MRAHAHIEDHIGRLKRSGLERFPFTRLEANQAWIQTIMWVADLVVWFKLPVSRATLPSTPRRLHWTFWRPPPASSPQRDTVINRVHPRRMAHCPRRTVHRGTRCQSTANRSRRGVDDASQFRILFRGRPSRSSRQRRGALDHRARRPLFLDADHRLHAFPTASTSSDSSPPCAGRLIGIRSKNPDFSLPLRSRCHPKLLDASGSRLCARPAPQAQRPARSAVTVAIDRRCTREWAIFLWARCGSAEMAIATLSRLCLYSVPVE